MDKKGKQLEFQAGDQVRIVDDSRQDDPHKLPIGTLCGFLYPDGDRYWIIAMNGCSYLVSPIDIAFVSREPSHKSAIAYEASKLSSFEMNKFSKQISYLQVLTDLIGKTKSQKTGSLAEKKIVELLNSITTD